MDKKGIKKKSEIPFKTRYAQIRNHLDFFLGQALEDVYIPLTIPEIKERLQNITKINISMSTINKDLEIFHKKYGEGLLCQIGDRYRLNHCLYKYIKIKPPKGYGDGNQI